MKKTRIIFVCKGNEERSPTAEAFAKEFIKANDLQDQIEVCSRGVYVDPIQRILKTEDINDTFLPNLLKVFITETALENNIFSPDQAAKFKHLLTKGNFDQVELNKLYLFAKIEATKRAKEIGGMIVLFTNNPYSNIAKLSDLIIQIEGKSKDKAIIEDTLAPYTTLFDISTLAILDSIGGVLMKILGVTEEDIDKRHASIE